MRYKKHLLNYLESPKAIHIMSGQTCCALLIRDVETNHVLWLIVANQYIYVFKIRETKI
jgi:hypothetical protein